MSLPCPLIRGLRQLTRGQNIDWNDILRLSPGTQEARKQQLLNKLQSSIPDITPAESSALAERLNREWEERRGKAIEREINKRLPKDATKETKQKLSKALPKLIQQINLGSLNNETLQELLSAEFGVGLTDPEVVKKLAKHSEMAQAAPPGVARNKHYFEMQKILEDSDGFSVKDAIINGDWWFASVLMRFGTFANVASGASLTAVAKEAIKALDAALTQGKPDIALKQFGAFIIGAYDAAKTFGDIVGRGNYAILPDAERRVSGVLSGEKGKDVLEALLRQGNLAGYLAYTRRIMTYLDYVAASAVRDSSMLYAALTRKDQASLQKINRRWDKKLSNAAYDQAKRDMGEGASSAEIRKRQKEILEEGVNQEIKDSSVQLARRVAANADPVGLAGMIYNGIKRMPWWGKSVTGLAFARSALNTISTASDFIPGLGLVTLWRSSDGFKDKYGDTGIGKYLGLPLSPEERRIAAWSQVVGFGIYASLLSWAMTDDDDEGFEISGGWKNVTPQQAKVERASGKAPFQIRFPGTSFRFSYRQTPFAPVLAMIGAIRDNKKYDKEKWDEKNIVQKLYVSWYSGLLFMKDVASLGQFAYILGANAGSTDDVSITKLNDWLSRSIGRAAGGMVPSVINEVMDIMDPIARAPLKDDILGTWAKNFPIAEYMNRPVLNFLGDPVELTKPPLRSIGTFEKQEPIYQFVGKWAAEGLFPRQAAMGTKIWDPAKKEMRQVTPQEFYDYQAVFGKTFKKLLLQVLPNIQNLNREAVAEVYQRLGDASAQVARADVQQKVLGK